LVALLLILGGHLRWLHTSEQCLRRSNFPFLIDSVHHMQQGVNLARGRSFPLVGPYVNNRAQLPLFLGPLPFWIMALPFLVSEDPLAGYGFAVLLNLSAGALLFLYARREMGLRTALIALALYAVNRRSVFAAQRVTNLFLSTPFLLLVLFALTRFARRWRTRDAALAWGALIAVTQFHLTAVPLLVLMPLLRLWPRRRFPRGGWLLALPIGLVLYATWLWEEAPPLARALLRPEQRSEAFPEAMREVMRFKLGDLRLFATFPFSHTPLLQVALLGGVLLLLRDLLRRRRAAGPSAEQAPLVILLGSVVSVELFILGIGLALGQTATYYYYTLLPFQILVVARTLDRLEAAVRSALAGAAPRLAGPLGRASRALLIAGVLLAVLWETDIVLNMNKRRLWPPGTNYCRPLEFPTLNRGVRAMFADVMDTLEIHAFGIVCATLGAPEEEITEEFQPLGVEPPYEYLLLLTPATRAEELTSVPGHLVARIPAVTPRVTLLCLRFRGLEPARSWLAAARGSSAEPTPAGPGAKQALLPPEAVASFADYLFDRYAH
jgi:hypothetical protein